ncbi:hypothetical protein HHI36_012423 [Cryptolaemus montrouzieri]|uniref:Uncharacterized protein n=1 Tax=Cryptolaemus montrouzieri TaxID=559131 RepID=A0ABD2NFD6_9CUCU
MVLAPTNAYPSCFLNRTAEGEKERAGSAAVSVARNDARLRNELTVPSISSLFCSSPFQRPSTLTRPRNSTSTWSASMPRANALSTPSAPGSNPTHLESAAYNVADSFGPRNE